MGGGEEVSRSISKHGKGKVPYIREDKGKGKGKGKQRESMPRLRCFICNGSLNALIKKSENEEKDARLDSM